MITAVARTIEVYDLKGAESVGVLTIEQNELTPM